MSTCPQKVVPCRVAEMDAALQRCIKSSSAVVVCASTSQEAQTLLQVGSANSLYHTAIHSPFSVIPTFPVGVKLLYGPLLQKKYAHQQFSCVHNHGEMMYVQPNHRRRADLSCFSVSEFDLVNVWCYKLNFCCT